MSGKLFIVSAPSGAGKTTLVNNVIERLSPHFSIERVVTYTSRAIRSGEQPGKDYHFVPSKEFQQKIKDGFFLEWSGQYDHYYGTPAQVLSDLKSGSSRILVIDRVGARRLMDIYRDTSPILSQGIISIWIHTSNIEELHSRLVGRGKNTLEQICRRLEIAKQEMEEEVKTPMYQHTIINDVFSEAAQELEMLLRCELE